MRARVSPTSRSRASCRFQRRIRGATLTEPAVLKRSIAELPTTYIKCLLDWPEPTETVATLLSNDGWRLVTMDTGHWPMFSQPRELAQILLDTTQA